MLSVRPSPSDPASGPAGAIITLQAIRSRGRGLPEHDDAGIVSDLSVRSQAGLLDRLRSAVLARNSALQPYWLALAGTAVLLLLRLALQPWLLDHAAFLAFIPAVLMAAAAGGFAPGLVATLLGLVLGMLFVGGD